MSKVDVLTRVGAELLARRLGEYWTKRGRAVNVRVEPNDAGYFNALRTADFYVVRSDMINGWPKK